RGFEDLGIRVLQGYGLTECAPLVSGTPYYENTYKKAGSVGKVVRHGMFDIIDKDEDGIGEILYKGPNVMVGYYRMPEETAKVLKDGWFHTGDLGFIDEEGWLYLTGRRKNVIVTKTGKNIYPEELEAYLNDCKFIAESMVYGVEDDFDEDTLVSAQIRPDYDMITEEFGESFDQDEIYQLIREEVAEINEKLPIYKRIRNVILREEEFIKTTTKKIKRYKNV
ncbi:MAG: AMP-binding protein, partial [Anaerovorax sp.]